MRLFKNQNKMIKFIMITLFFNLATSICHREHTRILSGTNVIQKEMFGWQKFQPYYIAYHDDAYDCALIHYEIFKNNNTINFHLYGVNQPNTKKIICKNNCDFTIDCTKIKGDTFVSYFVNNNEETFEYKITIQNQLFDPSKCLKDLIIIGLSMFFVVALFIFLLYQIKKCRENDNPYQLIINENV